MSRRHNKNLVSHPEDIHKTCSFPQTFPQITGLFLHTLPRRGMPYLAHWYRSSKDMPLSRRLRPFAAAPVPRSRPHHPPHGIHAGGDEIPPPHLAAEPLECGLSGRVSGQAGRAAAGGGGDSPSGQVARRARLAAQGWAPPPHFFPCHDVERPFVGSFLGGGIWWKKGPVGPYPKGNQFPA